MKSLFTLAIAFVFTSMSFGQNIIDKHFESYKSQDNFTTVSVSGKMFELAGYIEFDSGDEDLNELKDFISTITAFEMIAGRAVDNPRANYTSAISKVERSHEELMRVDDKEGSFTFFIDEQSGVVNEVVMVGTTEQEFIVFSLTGQMDLRELSKMAGKMQNAGFSKMDLIGKHGAAHVKVYPNPSEAGGEITLEIPEELMDGEARLFDMKGKPVNTFTMDQRSKNISTRGLSAGTYIIHIQKDGVTMKKRFVVQSK